MKNERLEQLKSYKEMLYMIDMIKGFVYKGPMHDEYIGHIIEEQVRLIERARARQQGYSFINEDHEENAVEFQVFPPHGKRGTDEVELVNGLEPYKKDAFLYYKNCTNGIFAPMLLSDVDAMEHLEVVIAGGCCTDICVMNFLISLKNYFNQKNRDIVVYVVKSATETYDAPNHNREYFNEIAYVLMKQAGIIVVNDIEALEQMEQKRKALKGGR